VTRGMCRTEHVRLRQSPPPLRQRVSLFGSRCPWQHEGQAAYATQGDAQIATVSGRCS